jgi:DNA-directed RNA polymerase II subunit RPB1
MTLALLDDIKHDLQIAKEVASSLQAVYMREIMKSYEVVYDPDIDNTVIEEDKEIVNIFSQLPDIELADDVEYSQYVVRMIFDSDILLDKGISLSTIVNRIRVFYRDIVYLEYNDEYEDKPVIRMRIIIEKSSKTMDMLPGEAAMLCEEATNVLLPLRISGIEGVKKTFVRKAGDEYVIDTEGSNIVGALKCDYINKTKIYSNNQNEVGQVFGCEAERACIYKEAKLVLSFDGNYINSRHPGLMADVMMHSGTVSAYNRHGINRRRDLGPLLKASFEETSEVFHKAARYAEVDTLNGITESIITGCVAPTGTGMFDLTLNVDMLQNAVFTPEVEEVAAAQRKNSTSPNNNVISIARPGRVFERNTFEFTPLLNKEEMELDFVPASPSREISVQ